MATALASPEPPALVLAPLNSAARKATAHERNAYCRIELENQTFGLWISFENPDKQMFTLGARAECDLFLPDTRKDKHGAEISPLQAAFHMVEETGAVLLTDYSEHRNTEPLCKSGGQTIPFRDGGSSPRTVLVAMGINTHVSFGRDKYYQFEIQWQSDGLYDFPRKDQPYRTGPYDGRVQKYLQGKKVGSGTYGTVWWVLDVVTGTRIAVKKFHHLSGKNLVFAMREIENLFRINKHTSIRHEHILEILDTAGGRPGDDWGEIYMPLMEGNLKALVEQTDDVDMWALSVEVLQQMLLALECIAEHKIVHRDIKPENILWDYRADGGHHFRLGDFGLSNDPNVAKTVAGTEPFMAPEIYHKRRQSTKVDIWSLFSTIVWVRNTQGFRPECSQLSAVDIHKWLVLISHLPEYADIKSMANMTPAKRPSARQLLMMFSGEGGADDPADELAEDFADMAFGMDAEGGGPGLGPESGSTDSFGTPYYEPYPVRGGVDSYAWEQQPYRGQGGRPYEPTQEGPRDQAFVAAYGEVYQRMGDDSGTLVAGTRKPPRPVAVDDDAARAAGEPHRKGKGKRK